MSVYITHTVLMQKIAKIKRGLQLWAVECYDSDVQFGEWSLGVGVGCEMKLSLPYTIKRTGELRYWIEAFYTRYRGNNDDLLNNIRYLE